MSLTFKIQIKGRVQGVGFRPFVFNLAIKNTLKGTVSNNEEGVVVFCNTSKKYATKFLKEIIEKKPKIAIITAYSIVEAPFTQYNDFSIIPTKRHAQINIPLTPDFAICQSCKIEISDLRNRRHAYAFTTCVHCGPRYAITQKFPFERTHTSMHNFTMCAVCKKEYTTAGDKRFHSQTNSCASCGIRMELTNHIGESVTVNQQEIINKAAQFLSEGKILAIKNTSGYVLCCDAYSTKAIHELRSRKKRPNKPFAVLYPTLKTIKEEFDLSEHESKALQSVVAPIVILKNTIRTQIATPAIAPNLNQTGVMLPSSALLECIMQKLQKPVVATSGNIHSSPITSKKEEAAEKLMAIADYFLHHNLDIQFPQDDSVVKFVNNRQLILRRSRGLAPNYMYRKKSSKEPVLAMGAHLKSTFTFVPNSQTYVSQYFGTLDNYDVLERYKTTIEQYIDVFETIPKTILIDKHSQYQSSILGNELAKEKNAKMYAIQHHKAHFASVLGEHDLFDSNEKVLGVVWDGTGLGDDNTIWGGEFFIYHKNKIERLAHFDHYDWLANEKMAKEPRLALFSLLNTKHRDIIKNKFLETEWNIYSKTIKNNTLKTSSVGRLFDAAASALDIVDINTFEAEAAMQLENCAGRYSGSNYIDLLQKTTYVNIPSKQLIHTIVKAYQEGFSKEQLAYSFIYTLAKCIIKMAKENHVKIIASSGGVFQNALLVSILRQMAKKERISLKLNRKLSVNDENISFGQLMYYNHIKN
ncbi:carbamoyltransferase HypF [Ascidiimonas aurantiaca]|uniref:carbamoyltransferase HypF n=1 Tax=Ascidiimonas aurantiaca TaxID=1685432 RepID=UPI0030EF8CE5